MELIDDESMKGMLGEAYKEFAIQDAKDMVKKQIEKKRHADEIADEIAQMEKKKAKLQKEIEEAKQEVAASQEEVAPAENTKPDEQALALIASETNTLAVIPASSNHSETDVSVNPLSGSLIEESKAKVQEKQAALERVRE